MANFAVEVPELDSVLTAGQEYWNQTDDLYLSSVAGELDDGVAELKGVVYAESASRMQLAQS